MPIVRMLFVLLIFAAIYWLITILSRLGKCTQSYDQILEGLSCGIISTAGKGNYYYGKDKIWIVHKIVHKNDTGEITGVMLRNAEDENEIIRVTLEEMNTTFKNIRLET